MSWIEDPAHYLVGYAGDLFDEFDQRFPLRFPFVRAYHGGRPISRNDYREHGLRLMGLGSLKAQAIEIFGESPALRKAMAELEHGHSRYAEGIGNQIYFCLDRREATGSSGHYLKYGSEYLLCIAARLREEPVLASRGMPILVHANLPFHWLTPGTRRELMGKMFEDLFCHLTARPLEDYHGLNFGFSIRQNLPPEQIVRLEKVTDFRTLR